MADNNEWIAPIVTALTEWSVPRQVPAEANSLRCVCSAERGGYSPSSIASVGSVPAELSDLWGAFRNLKLFVDVDYSQWGLRLLAPEEALHATQRHMARARLDYRLGDLVIGEFLGDAELALLRNDALQPDYENVVISQPIESRSCWPVAAPRVSDFLLRFVASSGAKFWEPHAES